MGEIIEAVVENTEKKDPKQEAMEILKKDQEARVSKARLEIAGVLKNNGCELQVAMVVSQVGNTPIIQVVPKANA